MTIIDAAKLVFLHNGFTDTSVDAIATEAGVSKQTIYNHFGDKEHLFREVVDAVQRDVAEATGSWFRDEFVESGDLGRDLGEIGRHWVRLFLREDIAALRRLVIAEQVRRPDLVDDWTRPRPTFEQAVSEEIARQVELGVLDITDVGLAARQLMNLVIYEALNQSRNGLRQLSDAEAGKIVDDGVEMWLRCYRVRPSSSGE